MASSYLSEGEAPRDFRVSSTESDGHYNKCQLCYTVKRNFYCVECVKSGGFVHSSMPYSDRFSEKQAKLYRLKVNRQHVLDRCEKLLSGKIKKDTLLTEAKLARDKIDLLKLAIEQRRSNIEVKKKELLELKHYNDELTSRMPRFEKRVEKLKNLTTDQQKQLESNMSRYTEQALSLGALRRLRIRQLTKYIFPVYMTYDISDSIEDLEFLGDDWETEPPKRSQLHIVAPWVNSDLDCAALEAWLSQHKDAEAGPSGAAHALAAHRASAALGLAAQLAALVAWTLDLRLPQPLALHDYYNWRVSEGGVSWRVRRVCVCCAALCARCGLPPSLPSPLAGLHALSLAATTDEHTLGRVEGWASGRARAASAAWARALGARALAGDDEAEPEHLVWPGALEMEEISSTPPPPAPSLVTSAAASIASMWRGWTK